MLKTQCVSWIATPLTSAIDPFVSCILGCTLPTRDRYDRVGIWDEDAEDIKQGLLGMTGSTSLLDDDEYIETTGYKPVEWDPLVHGPIDTHQYQRPYRDVEDDTPKLGEPGPNYWQGRPYRIQTGCGGPGGSQICALSSRGVSSNQATSNSLRQNAMDTAGREAENPPQVGRLPTPPPDPEDASGGPIEETAKRHPKSPPSIKRSKDEGAVAPGKSTANIKDRIRKNDSPESREDSPENSNSDETSDPKRDEEAKSTPNNNQNQYFNGQPPDNNLSGASQNSDNSGVPAANTATQGQNTTTTTAAGAITTALATATIVIQAPDDDALNQRERLGPPFFRARELPYWCRDGYNNCFFDSWRIDGYGGLVQWGRSSQPRWRWYRGDSAEYAGEFFQGVRRVMGIDDYGDAGFGSSLFCSF